MAFDSQIPRGTDFIAQGDNVIRANQSAIQAAVNLEHDFTDADEFNQTGRHMFHVGTLASLLALSLKQGSICYATDVLANAIVAYVYNAGQLWPIAGYRLDGGPSGNPLAPYMNQVNTWQRVQNAPWKVVAGGPSFALNLLTDPSYVRIELDQNILIDNPSFELGNEGYTVIYDIVQDGAGGRTVSFGSSYRSANGDVPIALGPNERTMLSVVRTHDGLYEVSSQPNWGVLIT